MPPRIKPSPFDKPELERYSALELEDMDQQKGLGRLLTCSDLEARWSVNAQFVKRARLGLNGGKTRLRHVAIGPKTIRYCLRDVLDYEWQNMS